MWVIYRSKIQYIWENKTFFIMGFCWSQKEIFTKYRISLNAGTLKWDFTVPWEDNCVQESKTAVLSHTECQMVHKF
jgi:hypothetical protein